MCRYVHRYKRSNLNINEGHKWVIFKKAIQLKENRNFFLHFLVEPNQQQQQQQTFRQLAVVGVVHPTLCPGWQVVFGKCFWVEMVRVPVKECWWCADSPLVFGVCHSKDVWNSFPPLQVYWNFSFVKANNVWRILVWSLVSDDTQHFLWSITSCARRSEVLTCKLMSTSEYQQNLRC